VRGGAGAPRAPGYQCSSMVAPRQGWGVPLRRREEGRQCDPRL